MTTYHDHFSATARQYAEFRPDYPPRLFEWLAEVAPATDRAWDCATGSGQAAVALAEHFREVVATDASGEQVANARPHRRVTYGVAPADGSGLPPASVDAVTVAQALHWFRLPEFYAEVARVLRRGGVLAAWCYGTFEVDEPRIASLLHDFYHVTVGPYWPAERDFVLTGYRTLPFPFDEITPPGPFTMQRDWTMHALLGYMRTWSACRLYARATGCDPVDGLTPALAAAWGDVHAPRTFRWPLSVRAGRLPSGA